MRIAASGREARAHACRQRLKSPVRLEHHLACQHKDELVLARMRMALRGLSTGHDACQVHTEIA